jgi:hypothetical protein
VGALQVNPVRSTCVFVVVSGALIGCRDGSSDKPSVSSLPKATTSVDPKWDESARRGFAMWERRTDDVEAQRLFDEACKSGSQLGCAGLGATLLSGGGRIEKDPPRGVKLLVAACDAKVGRACASLAKAYEDGLAVERDPVKAAEISRRACEEGEQRACVQYATSMLFGENRVVPDPQRSRDLAAKACESGIAAGCTLTGLAYSHALGDAIEAQTWLRRGCDAGDGAGCSALAYQYFHGGLPGEAKGVALDVRLGVELATRACDLGAQKGCALLARAYANGEGVAQDLARAGGLAAKACSAADAAGCSIAAKIAMHEGKTEDAAMFLERSCALGNAAACKQR